MQIRRREFLGSAVTGATGALLTGALPEGAQASTTASVSDDPVALVPLGQHLKVSRIGMGTGMRSWNQESNLTRRGEQHTLNTLRYAYDQGVRMFDMADLYGIHRYVAEALKDKPRDSYALSSKIWFHPGGVPGTERPDADVVIRRFLEELKTDYLDLVEIHCMTKPDWPKEFRKQMDLMEEAKQKGLIRAHGISSHSIPALEAAAEEPWVDVVHARINHLGAKMDGPPEQVVPVLKKIHAAGKGIIGMKILGEGTFAQEPDKRAASVDFVLSLGCVDTMIVGFEQASEIEEFKANVARGLKGRK
jgi:aryl-alcohol dehydrogenase-like predicted oxidoreductase